MNKPLANDMTIELTSLVTEALHDLKGQDIVVMDVATVSDFMDTMIVVTGTSNRHVKALAENLIEMGKRVEIRPMGVEGLETGDWVLVDYAEVVVHVMLPQTRAFYALEELWMPMGSENANGSR